jgi:PKD domain
MPNTQGFDVVAELTVDALNSLLKAAWKSGGDQSDTGVIPETITIPGPSVPNPLNLGPYQVKDGTIQIPQDQLSLTMNTTINGLNIKLGTIINLEIANPPVDAAKLFNLTADVMIPTPLRGIDNNEIIADFTALPPGAVQVTITSGDPLTPIISQGVIQFVHARYQDNTIPHTIDGIPISFAMFSMTCRVDFYDDQSDPSNQITVTNPDPSHIQVNIPTHIRFYNITSSGSLPVSLATPMGVTGTTSMLASYSQTDSNISVGLSTAVITLNDLTPAPGAEGTNYTSNKTLAGYVGVDLDTLVTSTFATAATTQLHNIGDINIAIPTLAQLNALAAAAVQNELQARQQIQIWQVQDVSGSNTTITSVTPQALSDCLAIAINNEGSGNSPALTNFIPASMDFAVATAAQKVLAEFDTQSKANYPLPYTWPQQIDGKTVKLNSLGMDLQNGYIEITGNVTVVNAILDSIDVSADFTQKVTLKWDPDGAAGQTIVPVMDGDPDIDLSAIAWILTALIGFLTLGVIGVIVGIVILEVVQGVASDIGAQVAQGEINKYENAWPVKVDKIGNVEAHFYNPIGIDTGGLLFGGKMIITSLYEATLIDMANTHGPYTTKGNLPVNFNGGAPHPVSLPKWNLGDGSVQTLRSLSYSYGESGLYVAQLGIQVTQTGGLTSANFTTVQVDNVAPVVQFSPTSLTLPEGQTIQLNVAFTDENWLDTHTALFDFGDNTALASGTVQETNLSPLGKGTAVVSHAWCRSGSYTVSVQVQDDKGGIGTATLAVQVTNVPPKIVAPRKICVLRDQNMHLEAIYTDPGWCEKHTAVWDTGDGHILMATIKEQHTPPQLIGHASASHVYHGVGHYVATITVTDDNGASDTAHVMVMVTELYNHHFEKGFRIWYPEKKGQNLLAAAAAVARTGTRQIIANSWFPFTQQLNALEEGFASGTAAGSAAASGAGAGSSAAPAAAPGGLQVRYEADEIIVRDGQRSQVLEFSGGGMAGIFQSVCANKCWDYEFTAFYHLPSLDTQCRFIIGIDPQGGNDPSDPGIQWVEALPHPEWREAAVRVRAEADRITCFAGILQEEGPNVLYIDHACLYMIQPKYSHWTEDKREENNCPVDQMEGHDFNRLTGYMSKPALLLQSSAQANTSAARDVRFLTTPARASGILLKAAPPAQSLSDLLVKGVAQVSGSIAKNLVTGTIQTIFPFLKKKG